jgi:hypothetical protein
MTVCFNFSLLHFVVLLNLKRYYKFACFTDSILFDKCLKMATQKSEACENNYCGLKREILCSRHILSQILCNTWWLCYGLEFDSWQGKRFFSFIQTLRPAFIHRVWSLRLTIAPSNADVWNEWSCSSMWHVQRQISVLHIQLWPSVNIAYLM